MCVTVGECVFTGGFWIYYPPPPPHPPPYSSREKTRLILVVQSECVLWDLAQSELSLILLGRNVSQPLQKKINWKVFPVAVKGDHFQLFLSSVMNRLLSLWDVKVSQRFVYF